MSIERERAGLEIFFVSLAIVPRDDREGGDNRVDRACVQCRIVMERGGVSSFLSSVVCYRKRSAMNHGNGRCVFLWMAADIQAVVLFYMPRRGIIV